MNEFVIFLLGVMVGVVLLNAFTTWPFQKGGVVKQATKEIEPSDDYEVVQVGYSWLFMIRDVGCVSASGSTTFSMPNYIHKHCLFDSRDKAVRVGMKYYQVHKAIHSFKKGN